MRFVIFVHQAQLSRIEHYAIRLHVDKGNNLIKAIKKTVKCCDLGYVLCHVNSTMFQILTYIEMADLMRHPLIEAKQLTKLRYGLF